MTSLLRCAPTYQGPPNTGLQMSTIQSTRSKRSPLVALGQLIGDFSLDLGELTQSVRLSTLWPLDIEIAGNFGDGNALCMTWLD